MKAEHPLKCLRVPQTVAGWLQEGLSPVGHASEALPPACSQQVACTVGFSQQPSE